MVVLFGYLLMVILGLGAFMMDWCLCRCFFVDLYEWWLLLRWWLKLVTIFWTCFESIYACKFSTMLQILVPFHKMTVLYVHEQCSCPGLFTEIGQHWKSCYILVMLVDLDIVFCFFNSTDLWMYVLNSFGCRWTRNLHI